MRSRADGARPAVPARNFVDHLHGRPDIAAVDEFVTDIRGHNPGQPRRAIERPYQPVCRTTQAQPNLSTVLRETSARCRRRLPVVADEIVARLSQDKRPSQEQAADRTFQNMDKQLGIGVNEKLSTIGIPSHPRTNRGLNRVPQVLVMRCALILSPAFPSVRVQGQSRIRVQVVRYTRFAIQVGTKSRSRQFMTSRYGS